MPMLFVHTEVCFFYAGVRVIIRGGNLHICECWCECNLFRLKQKCFSQRYVKNLSSSYMIILHIWSCHFHLPEQQRRYFFIAEEHANWRVQFGCWSLCILISIDSIDIQIKPWLFMHLSIHPSSAASPGIAAWAEKPSRPCPRPLPPALPGDPEAFPGHKLIIYTLLKLFILSFVKKKKRGTLA